jgi:trigger factor
VGVQLPPRAPIISILKEFLVKVSVNDVTGCTKEITVEVPADTVQTKMDRIYSRISQEAKIPGFRKGKVPLDVIRKQYKAAAREEMVQHQLPEFFRSVLIEQKIDPVAQPQIMHLQFDEGTPMKFVATVEIKPAFELKNYKGLAVKKAETKVTEQDVDKAIENLRNQMAQLVPVERAAQGDDWVLIDFEGKIDGVVFEGGKATRYPVLLGSQSLLKDFEENLIGLKAGDSKTFKITFPADYGKKEISGKEAEFTVKLHEIKAKNLPALDDEFAKDGGKAETVKGLRAKLEAQIKHDKENEQRSKMIEQIGEALIAAHKFDVPASLIQLEQQRLVQQGVERLRSQGIDANQLPDEQKKQFVEGMKPVAEKNVHLALIVEKISTAEKVKTEEVDIEAYIQKVSGNVGQPIDVVRRYVQQQGNMDSIKDWIQYEKTLDFLIAQSKIEIV